MIALRLWSKLRIGRYSLLAGSIYKSKLNYFVFYNLKHVKLHVACITMWNKIEHWIKEPRISLIIN